MPGAPAPLVRALDAALEATVVLSFSRIGYEVRSRAAGWSDPDTMPGAGRRVVITGANSGLGFATARHLLASGARVLLTVRSDEKGEEALDRLQAELGTGIRARATADVLDLADLASVRAFAARRQEEAEDVDALVHNAGAMFAERDLTIDGLERTYQIHVVGPFLLTSLLLPRLAASASGRVVTVTSGGMYAEKLDTASIDSPDGYRPTVAYARAKRAQVTLTRQWARRAATSGVAFHVAHPGWASTPGIERSLPGFTRLAGPILRDPAQGSDTVAYLTLADDLPTDGRLWHDRRPRSDHRLPWTRPDRGEAGQLWARVCRDAGIEPTV